MRRDYEGKIGIGQTIFCLLALATLLIPFALSTKIFAVQSLTAVTTAQTNYLTDFAQLLSVSITIPAGMIYVLYAFYGIVGLTLLLTILMWFLRNELVRQILRVLSVLTGFIMIAIFIVNLLTVAGFFAYYMNGDFGDELIIDCITEQGLLFFLGVTVMSAVGMVKYFSSFFGKSY